MNTRTLALGATAAVALVCSVNVWAAAAPKITGAEVVDGSLSGVDIANNSLTGAQIDESSLAGVNATTLNGKADTAFASAAALATLTARVAALESSVATQSTSIGAQASRIGKLEGSGLTVADLAGTYVVIGYQSEIGDSNGASAGGVHVASYVQSMSMVVDGTGNFTLTPDPTNCEVGTQWTHDSSLVAPFSGAGCSGQTAGTLAVSGSSVFATFGGGTVEFPTVSGGRLWLFTHANAGDGTTGLLTFTKVN